MANRNRGAAGDVPEPADARRALVVFAAPDAGSEVAARAARLADHLRAPLIRKRSEIPGALTLRVDSEGLALAVDGMEMQPDFTHLQARIKPQRLSRELLVQAVRIKDTPHPLVIDATAGLGEDSLILAAAGCRVELFEHDPVIAALLDDALERAAREPALAPIAARMHLHEGDSTAALRTWTPAPDVVYLDPMFPARQKSAAVKKKFQLLHLLEQPCSDERGLLEAALAACPRKIVIKRPAKGPVLAGLAPAYSRSGKSIRFDVLIPAQLPR
ncbi:MAG: class I SAM-dependent methyltransferase [Eggerthellaceae bacterium]